MSKQQLKCALYRSVFVNKEKLFVFALIEFAKDPKGVGILTMREPLKYLMRGQWCWLLLFRPFCRYTWGADCHVAFPIMHGFDVFFACNVAHVKEFLAGSAIWKNLAMPESPGSIILVRARALPLGVVVEIGDNNLIHPLFWEEP